MPPSENISRKKIKNIAQKTERHTGNICANGSETIKQTELKNANDIGKNIAIN